MLFVVGWGCGGVGMSSAIGSFLLYIIYAFLYRMEIIFVVEMWRVFRFIFL